VDNFVLHPYAFESPSWKRKQDSKKRKHVLDYFMLSKCSTVKD